LSTSAANDRDRLVAHPIRGQILADLEESPIPLSVKELVIATNATVSQVVYHLRVLADANWLRLSPVDTPPEELQACVPGETRTELQRVLRRRRIDQALGEGRN
jgi:DNA-binding transcriptional ArsR family regulator